MERPKIGYCQRIDEAPSILIVNTARLHELVEYSVWAEQQLSKLHQPTVISPAVCDHPMSHRFQTRSSFELCLACRQVIDTQTDL